ncbi:hypothetical protein JTB14_009037 [Gonioctena quinquepunctata]|nr:hypothetical protein JTB14_009037 [Gonioctena quinquepunctata]
MYDVLLLEPNSVFENATERVWSPHKKASSRDNEAMKIVWDENHNKHGLWLNIANKLRKAGYDIGDDLKKSEEKCRQNFPTYRRDKDKAIPRLLVDSLEIEPVSPPAVESSFQNDNEEAGPSTDFNSENNSSIQTSRKEQAVPDTPNIFSSAKQSLKIQTTKNLIIDQLKIMNEKHLNELRNITTVIKTNKEKQNTLLENLCQQRQQLIDILKILCEENSRKR